MSVTGPAARHILRRAVLALGLLAVALVGGTASTYWRWSRAALPRLDGEARLPGLGGPALVRRDGLGVPHVQAGSVLDAVRAQGYVTAQDRLWQMDLMRRRALGELAEAFGEGALRADKEIRTLGLEGAAREALELCPPDLRAHFEAYAAGVNAFLESHRAALPLEFRLLRYQPRPWTPVDSVVIGKLLALDLAESWDGEDFRAVVADKLPPELQDLLFPTTFPHDRVLYGSDGAPAAAGASAAERSRGSNNWVVSGAHTASGLPLLANDPHLSLGVPSIWAAVHLTADGFDVAGVTLPGAPGVVLGRNRRVAWGATHFWGDDADLYLEEFDPNDPDRYRVGDAWERVVTREERIRVRAGRLSSSWRTELHRVRRTRHGPLIESNGRTYALRWTALEKASEFTAFALMDRAAGWRDFEAALREYPGPAQNIVYADVEGRVAWHVAGRLPIRRSGDGSRPYPGATSEGDWLGFVPFEELPHLVDPPSGRIVTANNRVIGTDYPYPIWRGGIGPWRAAAIFEALESHEAWTADGMARLQGERLSIPHRDLARALLEAAGRHKGDSTWDEIARELEGWDGRLEAVSRPAALVVATFLRIGERVLGPRLKAFPQAFGLRRRTGAVQRLVLDRPAAFLPTGEPDWDTVLRGAWKEAVLELVRTQGADRSRWTYGRMNRMGVAHPLASAIPALGWLLSPPTIEMGGRLPTPNVLVISEGGSVEGPSMRFVANLADPDDTRLVNFMGQSGHPASPHYADQFDLWVRVESRRLPFTAEAVEREARHTLRLVP